MLKPTALTYHPTLVHPLTGARLQAVGFRRSGTPIWPIMGGDGSEDDANDKGGAGGGGDDLGFPKDTPVAEMKPEEQAAYWKHAARRHEDRAKEWAAKTGKKNPDDVVADLTELGNLKRSQLSDADKALEEAREKGRQEARAEAAPRLARAALEARLEHLDSDKREALIDTIDLSKLVTASGDVDTDKVKTLVDTIAPADKGQGGRRDPDYGGGRRSGGAGSSGVAAGRQMFEDSRRKTTTTNGS